jgi:hypothetical protein
MTEILNNRTQPLTTLVALNTLESLKATTFSMPEHATRPLDNAHVATLTGTDSNLWPPLKVVETDDGLVVIDGYHRWHARVRQAVIDALGIEEATPILQEKALSEPLDPTVQELVDATTIRVEIGVYETEKEIAKAALTANLTHGLQPRGKARVAIGLELYDITRGDIPEPTQVDIARIVGINKATLNEYLKKREREQATEQAATTGKAENDVSEGTEDKGKGEKVLKAAQKLIKDLADLYELEPHAHTKVVQTLFPAIVDGMCDVYADQNEKTYADSVTSLISKQDGFSGNHAEHVNKLGKALTSAAKKLERLSPQVVK